MVEGGRLQNMTGRLRVTQSIILIKGVCDNYGVAAQRCTAARWVHIPVVLGQSQNGAQPATNLPQAPGIKD